MRETLTSSPELFSDISWNLLLLGEETAKKWDHSEFNIEHIVHTLFTSSEFFHFIEKLSIDQDTVLDITEEFLEDTPINESDIFTIGEDLEILLDNANQIKSQWGSKLIEIPHLLIALGRDLRIGNYVFQEGNLSIEKLEEKLKFFPNFNQTNNPCFHNRSGYQWLSYSNNFYIKWISIFIPCPWNTSISKRIRK